ncbi:MAG TPA: 16S rRNA (guanine(527)-N(7))-methyltransferase RsmG [Gammaproteobacteria bacterium]|nr:16S rRNA (guanine(527)-N(7))-methyltransferase RsmG [Gammaproteobacteria bacterium]
MDESRVQQLIEQGLAELDLREPPGLAAALAGYLELLARWNRTYNLTAVREPEEMVTRHVLDSLVVLPFIDAERMLDVGTGAGLPGLVLAMARPGQRFVLLDSSGKKTRFVEHAATRLGLGNVEVVQARVEDHEDEEGFAVVLSRAFASVADFIRLAGHLARTEGRLLAMKGALPEAELAALPAGWGLQAVHKLSVPGLAGRRHLLEFCRKDNRT